MSSAEKIGLAAGLSPFIIGVTIVGVGTSFPEVVSAFAAMLRGVTEIIPANAVGANITNILLNVGLAAVIARRLIVTKNLINLDLPMLSISVVLLLGIVRDGQVTFFESILLLITYGIYLFYMVTHKEEEEYEEAAEMMPSRQTRRKHITAIVKKVVSKPKFNFRNFLFLSAGIICLLLGAHYLIESIVNLSKIFNIGVGVITMTAVSLGTTLPEFTVSIKAALQKKSEIIIGNIFGSNMFNALAVIGLPGLFGTIHLSEKTLMIGIPTMTAATLIFVISCISKRIHIWEGALYLIVYILFIGKLFGLF